MDKLRLAMFGDALCRPHGQTSLPMPPRNAKYNQLLRIAEDLGESALYGGSLWRKG